MAGTPTAPKRWTAYDIMTERVVTIRARATFKELAKLLNRHRISGVPVLDERGRLVGVVSQTDLVRGEWGDSRAILNDYFMLPGDEVLEFEPEREGRVMDIMSRGYVSVPAGAPVAEIASLMLARRIHRVLVTRGDELLGVVSSLDLLKTIAEEAP